MDNSSLIPYYNTQNELKVLTFEEIMYYQSNKELSIVAYSCKQKEKKERKRKKEQ
jgi:hypothetical protein